MQRRTTVLLDADLMERLERHARLLRTTKTAVLAQALETYLSANEVVADLPFVGVGRSGHGRLSLDARSIAGREIGRPARR
jgi:predicted transcriptional regulator